MTRCKGDPTDCTTIEVMVPDCEPMQEPPAEQQTNCSSCTNQVDCQTAGCSRQFTSAGPGFCK